MRFFFIFFFLFFSSESYAAVAAAAYSMTSSTGAIFDATQGILPAATPFTFAPSTAANEAVNVTRAFSLDALTPFGTAAGGFTEGGFLSAAAVDTLGASLAAAAPVLIAGGALYLAYKAANFDVSTGQPLAGGSVTIPGVGICAAPVNGGCSSLGGNGIFPAPIGCPSGNLIANNSSGYVSGSCMLQAPLPGSTPSPAQEQAAINSWAGSSNSNAAQLASDANKAGIPLPKIVPDPSLTPVPSPMVTPWVTTHTQIDPSTGVSTQTQTQAQLQPQPNLAPSLTDPIPVQIQTNTQTLTNGVPTSSSTDSVANVSPNTSPSSATSPNNNAPPAPDPCTTDPNHLGCVDLGTAPTPEAIKQVPIDLSSTNFNTFSFSGSAACPAPQSVSILGQSISVSFTPICSAMSMFKPIALAVAFFVAGLIIIGQRQSAAS